MKILKFINIRSNYILLFVALLCLGGFYIVENNKIMRKNKWYDEKLAASNLCKHAGQTLKNFYFGEVEYINNMNDPNETGLIGLEYSPITSERGSFSAKSTSTNPNFAALIVEFLKELDIKEGEQVAVGITGSFPALNIAACSAIQTLKLKPIIICSVASSSWGANDPDFTWLDMAKVLSDSGIFKFQPVAASIGASMDIGRGLSLEGVEMIKTAIKRNNIKFIYAKSLKENISKRMQIYDSCARNEPIKAFINIGGGIACLGSSTNGDHIPQGRNKNLSLNLFKDKIGVMFEMAKRGIPIIQISDIKTLATKYDLPEKPIPMPMIGSGQLFESKKYNMAVVTPITLFLLVLIIFIIYQDKKNVRLGKEVLRTEQKNDNDLIL